LTATHTLVESPIGALTLVAEDGALTGLYFPHHWYRPDPATFGPRVEHGFDEVRTQLAEYFAGERRDFDLPLHAIGTVFQKRVWQALLDIPYGRTASYGATALAIGAPTSSRAVGLANGQNPISIVVPCHRVIGANGSLTGYGGGMAAKQWLLAHEAAHSGLFANA
jgi:methylated-DNA-[protein]-cysteine S-methyltransferase